MSYTFQHREEIDLQMIVDEQTRKLQRFVDEATLDNAADTLANFGYVKADGKSRWLELFGTPERAARTLLRNGKSVPACYACLVRDECANLPKDYYECPMDGYDALLEWLRGESDGE